jgi:hypothetical protein
MAAPAKFAGNGKSDLTLDPRNAPENSPPLPAHRTILSDGEAIDRLHLLAEPTKAIPLVEPLAKAEVRCPQCGRQVPPGSLFAAATKSSADGPQPTTEQPATPQSGRVRADGDGDPDSYAVNSELIRAGKVGLRHNLTRDAVHALISMYAVAAGFQSQLVYLGPGRIPRLYSPNDAARQQWEAAHKPATLRAVAEALEKITRLKTLLTTPEPQRSPAGKPGRKCTTRDIAIYANERRPEMTWKEICSAWKHDHPDDPRNAKLTGETIRDSCRRHFGAKKSGLNEKPALHPADIAAENE